MVKKIFLGIFGAIILGILIFVFYPQAEHKTEYKINATLKPSEGRLIGAEEVTYYNTSNVSMSQIYFHIFPNAFVNEDSINSSGSINFKTLKVETYDADYKIYGADNTLLKISLRKPLKPGRKVDINMDFIINIPYNMYGDRFSFNKDAFNLGNCFPIAAVYDERGWNLDPYYKIGDPFYSEVANYDVKLTTPKDFLVAASGEQVEVKATKANKTYNFKEENLRDFAAVASNKFKYKEDVVDGIKIKQYFLDATKDREKTAMEAAKNSLKIFNKNYGQYPYKSFSVVGTSFYTGMEYPGLIYINKEYYKDTAPKDILESVIAHETAHQWWYGVVGDNQIDEAWLDEGFATYSEALFYEKNYSKSIGNAYYKNRIAVQGEDQINKNPEVEDALNELSKGKQVNSVVKSLSNFASVDDYSRLVYKKGAETLGMLRERTGDKAFFEIMSKYYEMFKFKVAKTQDFIDVVDEVTGKEYKDFFANALYNKRIELVQNKEMDQKWYEKLWDSVKRKLGFSKYTQGELVKMKYFEAVFSDAWNNTEADEFALANTKNYVSWTAHVTFINSEKLLTLREGKLPEIWVEFKDNTIKNKKLKVGDLITIKGNLEEYRHSGGFIVAYDPPEKDPPQWVVTNCKIEPTTDLNKKELQAYLDKVKTMKD